MVRVNRLKKQQRSCETEGWYRNNVHIIDRDGAIKVKVKITWLLTGDSLVNQSMITGPNIRRCYRCHKSVVACTGICKISKDKHADKPAKSVRHFT
jgi:hypothetical protein